MTKCWYCGAEMIWQSDFNADEVFGEGYEGIVTYLKCPACNADAEFSQLEEPAEDGSNGPDSA